MFEPRTKHQHFQSTLFKTEYVVSAKSHSYLSHNPELPDIHRNWKMGCILKRHSVNTDSLMTTLGISRQEFQSQCYDSVQGCKICIY